MIPTHGHSMHGPGSIPTHHGGGHGHPFGLHHPFDDAASTHSSTSTSGASGVPNSNSATENGGASPSSSSVSGIVGGVGGGGRSRAGSMVENPNVGVNVAMKAGTPPSVGLALGGGSGMGGGMGNPVMSMFF